MRWKPLVDLTPASVVSELPSPIATCEEITVLGLKHASRCLTSTETGLTLPLLRVFKPKGC